MKLPINFIPEIPESSLSTSVQAKLNTVAGTSGYKYLTAADVGLVTMDWNSNAPFTGTEYTNAYNNGINLSNAIEQAYNDGYSGIVLERGSYPFTSNRGTTTNVSGSNTVACYIEGIKDFDLNFNGSVFFVLYDSNNRNPYDITANPIYQLPYFAFRFRDCQNINISNIELRGDNYMRSWIAGEENDIGCYGLHLQVNCQNFVIENFEGHGFRCEPLTISYAGYSNKTISTFYLGGIDDTTGADIVETGSYRTPLIDLTTGGFTIVDNSFSIVGWGFTREIPFRNSLVKILYYDASDNYLTWDWSVQNKLNYLPTNATKVRLVAYGDERTDATVDYSSVALTSGTPRNLKVSHSKFYNNMRGCISGASNNTVIEDCVFHTIGKAITNKFGWLSYNDTTQFAIDIEDGMPDFIKIIGNRFEDCGHAFLTPACQTLYFQNNICTDIQYDSTVINTKYSEVSGNVFSAGTSIGGGLSVTHTQITGAHSTKVMNNHFIDTQLYVKATNNKSNTVIVDGNTYLKTKIYLEGNVVSTNNYHYGFNSAYQTVVEARDVIRFDDYIEEKEGLTTWERYNIDSRNNDSRAKINIRNTAMRFGINNVNIPSIHFYGDTSGTLGTPWDTTNPLTQNYNGSIFENLIKSWGDGVSYATLPDYTVNFNEVKFINTRFSLNRRTTTDGGDMIINFNDCTFDFTDLVTLNLITNYYTNTGGTVTINFNYCIFKSDTSKSVNITSGTTIVGLTVNNTSPTYRNVTLI